MKGRWEQQYRRALRSFEACRGHYVTGTELGLWGTSTFEEQEEAFDKFIHLFQDLLHIRDWISHDSRVKQSTKTAVVKFVKTNPTMMLCRDVAVAAKHCKVDQELTNKEAGLDTFAALNGPMGTFPIGLPYKYYVLIEMGVSRDTKDAFTFAQECIREWESFLKTHCLSIPTI